MILGIYVVTWHCFSGLETPRACSTAGASLWQLVPGAVRARHLLKMPDAAANGSGKTSTTTLTLPDVPPEDSLLHIVLNTLRS